MNKKRAGPNGLDEENDEEMFDHSDPGEKESKVNPKNDGLEETIDYDDDNCNNSVKVFSDNDAADEDGPILLKKMNCQNISQMLMKRITKGVKCHKLHTTIVAMTWMTLDMKIHQRTLKHH